MEDATQAMLKHIIQKHEIAWPSAAPQKGEAREEAPRHIQEQIQQLQYIVKRRLLLERTIAERPGASSRRPTDGEGPALEHGAAQSANKFTGSSSCPSGAGAATGAAHGQIYSSLDCHPRRRPGLHPAGAAHPFCVWRDDR